MNRNILLCLILGVFLSSCHSYSTRDKSKDFGIKSDTSLEEEKIIAPRTEQAPAKPMPKTKAIVKKELPPPPPPLVMIEEVMDIGAIESEEDIEEEIEPGIITGNFTDQEEYATITENEFLNPKNEALSTFSIDVDNASYSNVRRMLSYGSMPDANSVRIEEMINYFTYDYEQPKGKDPFSITTEINECPWNKKNKLLHIGLQGYKVDFSQAPANNLVFLLDVSGSMNDADKLSLVKESMEMILGELREEDRVAIVVYAGAAGLVLPSTSAKEKGKIMAAIDKLSAGGSTAGGAGIQLAYKTAKENFIRKGNNRIILCTDGDFNVGVSSKSGLQDLIEEKRNEGVFLTVLGFGMGNYKDNRLETLADKGNGNYGYIDNLNEAKKMLVDEMGGTFLTIAKDAKIQVEFNPEFVESYRLIGYENRKLANRDFDDDTKDAGELGAGHSVTALYEIVPKGKNSSKDENNLRYQYRITKNTGGEEFAYVKFRYKKPDGDKSILMDHTILNSNNNLSNASENYKFSAAVAGWGLLLRNSKFKENATYKMVYDLADKSKGEDPFGYRTEFLSLIKKSENLSGGIIEAHR